MTVTAQIWYDATHLVGYDLETGDEIEEGRWTLTIETPDGELNRVSKSVTALVAYAEKWGEARGVHVDIHYLNMMVPA